VKGRCLEWKTLCSQTHTYHNQPQSRPRSDVWCMRSRVHTWYRWWDSHQPGGTAKKVTKTRPDQTRPDQTRPDQTMQTNTRQCLRKKSFEVKRKSLFLSLSPLLCLCVCSLLDSLWKVRLSRCLCLVFWLWLLLCALSLMWCSSLTFRKRASHGEGAQTALHPERI
jgi:hypothetical protein